VLKTRRFVRYAGAAVLGLLAAVALGSCGGSDGVAVGTGTITRSLPSVPVVTESVTVTEPGAGATETVTVTETAPTVTETAPTVTETAPAETEIETVTVTETAPAETTEAAPAVTVIETVTVTTTEGVSPAAAAAAGAAAGSADEDGLTSSEWGWVAFGVLAAAVAIGGIVMWLRRRSAAKTA
jgi:hypothetical protein